MSRDATGPLPAGRIEESQAGTDHATASRREIGQTERHVRRLLKRLKGTGDGALVRALRGHRSNRKLDKKSRQKALEILSRDVYRGFGPDAGCTFYLRHHTGECSPFGSGGAVNKPMPP